MYRDEAHLTMVRNPAPEPKKTKYPPNQPREVHNLLHTPAKTTSNISLGTENGVWESVSHGTLKKHAVIPRGKPSDYEALEKKRSTVLDYPDLHPPPWQSAQQAAYSLQPDIDRSSLKYDNENSVKNLKMTHLSVKLFNLAGTQ